MRPLSLRTRVTLIAAVVVAVALTTAALILAGALRDNLQRGALQEADRKLTAAASAVRQGAVAPGPSADPDVHVEGLPPVVSAPPPGQTESGDAPADRVNERRTIALGSHYATAAQAVSTDNGRVTVQVRVSLAPTRQALALVHKLLIFGVPALVLLVAILTWYLTGRVLAPVASIRTIFADITVKDLHQRVPVPRTQDEIGRLARTMNATLDRLEATVERHKRFVADAAHELRSPIATLRTRLELGTRQAPALVGEALADVARLQDLAMDLLLLARLDAGEPVRLEEVDLGQLAAEAALRPSKVKIVLDVRPDVVLPGSRRHIARMITNLVDNAARHASSTVTIRVTPEGLDVIDDGPGIPEEHRESVFDRFARLDEARARDTGGSGLGLAIARDIATAHGASLAVADSSTGAHLSFRILPSSPPAAHGGRGSSGSDGTDQRRRSKPGSGGNKVSL